MKSYSHPYGRDLASLLANSAALHTLYRIMQQSADPSGGLRNWLIWAAGILIAYPILELTLRSDQTRPFLPVSAVLPAAGVLAGVWFFGDSPTSPVGWVGLAFFLGIVQVQIVEHITKNATPESRLLDFETCTLILIVAVLLQTGGTMSRLDLIPPAIGSALSLIGLVWQRTGAGKTSGRIPTMLYTIALPGAALTVLTLLFLTLSPLFSRGIRTLVGGIRSLGGRILSLVYRGLLWFLSLFPGSSEELLPEMSQEAAQDLSAGVSTLPDANTVLTPILILMILIGFIGFFTIARSSRISIARPNREPSRIRSHLSLREILRQFFRRIRRKLHRSLFCLLHPKAPQTQFIRLEDTMKRRHTPRASGETPRNFLLRCTEYFPERAEELSILADQLDQIYFMT